MVTIGIIGRGAMGRSHARAWSELGLGPQIAYVCSTRPGPPLEGAPSARSVTDVDEILRDPRVDIVSICTPTTTHADLAIRALAAGKNVLLEKPIALDLGEARAISEAAARSTAILMVAHVVRFFGGYSALRETVASGTIGRMLSARAERISSVPGPSPWWHDEEKSGGLLVDFAIHDFDQLNLFLGTPVSVTTSRRDSASPVEATVDYAHGGQGRVLSFMGMPEDFVFTSSLELVGTSGLADHRFSGDPVELGGSEPGGSGTGGSGNDSVRVLTATAHTVSASTRNPYAVQAEYFLDCIARGAQPELAPTEAAIQALAVSLAARESRATGKPAAVRLG
jgi:predicted dehydrogenase